MKKATDWIKHEYRILNGFDNPTHKDYLLGWKLIFFISSVLPFLIIATSIIFLKILLLLNICLNSLVGYMLSFMFIFLLTLLLTFPLAYLLHLNSNYNVKKTQF